MSGTQRAMNSACVSPLWGFIGMTISYVRRQCNNLTGPSESTMIRPWYHLARYTSPCSSCTSTSIPFCGYVWIDSHWYIKKSFTFNSCTAMGYSPCIKGSRPSAQQVGRTRHCQEPRGRLILSGRTATVSVKRLRKTCRVGSLPDEARYVYDFGLQWRNPDCHDQSYHAVYATDA